MGEIADIGGVIYRIDCETNGRFYIGSAINFGRRKYLHLWSLRRGSHHNAHLQRIFDKCGENSLTFTVIEYGIHQSELAVRETHYIRLLTPAINHNSRNASRLGTKHTDASKSLVSKANTGRKMVMSIAGMAVRQAHARQIAKPNRHALKVTATIKDTIDQMRAEGMGCRRIAVAVGLNKTTIQNVFKGKHNYG